MLVESSPRKPSRHVADTCVPLLQVVPSHPMAPLVLFSAPRTHLLRPREGISGQGPSVPGKVSRRLLTSLTLCPVPVGREREWKGAGICGWAHAGSLAWCWPLSSHYIFK